MSIILSFKQKIQEFNSLEELLRNLDLEFLGEEAAERGKVANNTKGVLHELLVGYHLNNGNHMEKYRNEEGESPKQAHDRLKATIHTDNYKKIHDRAKSAAEDIRKQAETRGHKISTVHWTSKPGDLKQSTGIEASQQQDASDIVLHTHHSSDKSKKKPRFMGVSLKVSDKPDKHVPSSNLGIESLGPKAKKTFDDHRKSILSAHPKLQKATNKETRKEWLKSNQKAQEHIKRKNGETLVKVAKDLSDHLNDAHHKDLVTHIRKVVHAHSTPMQDEGHEHIKHITYGAKTTKHHTVNPAADFEHILKDHKNITVHHSGTGVLFKHKGKTFAKQTIKFDSQSDPLSSLKSAGRTAG
jgi:hypothetical protein